MNSKLILAKNIKNDRNYNNVLSYSESDMLSLLTNSSHLVAQASNYSFIKSTGTIMCGFTYEQCLQSNYIAFQNPNYSNKWFFAWIDDVIYKGNKNTEITFTIDAWSTWYTKWTPKKCFIKRQHVLDDTIGLNTIEENLDVGDVIEEQETTDISYKSSTLFYVGILSAWHIKDGSTGDELTEGNRGSQFAGVSVYNNTVFGNELFLIKITSTTDFKKVYLFINRTAKDKHIEDIQDVFIVPDALIQTGTLTMHSASVGNLSQYPNNGFDFYTMDYNITPTTFDTTINKRTSFTGITVKNNKCYCYPYNYLYVSNNNGSNNIYKYEDFTSTSCVFQNQLSLSVGISGRIVPKDYKNIPFNDDESLALGKYPTCQWSSDSYTNWLTQNAVNMSVTAGITIGAIALGVATGGLALPTVAASASMGVAGLIGQFSKKAIEPNIQGGQPTGDIIWSSDNNCFVFREMRAKNENMKIIDDYFTKYGYAIKSIETPNLTGRTYWNYIEIDDSEEIGYGDVPSKYMEIINKACRRGVTIWHNHANLGDYSLNNTIVTPVTP